MIELKGEGCTVKMIEDSISPDGKRLTTMQLRYWRGFHSETMTHRVFSRNASSSRAIPILKMIEQVSKDAAGPIFWGANRPGMSADTECDNLIEYPPFMKGPLAEFFGVELDEAPGWLTRSQAWEFSGFLATTSANAFNKAGYHKQVVNRLLEPWQYISVIVTATEWNNFMELRDHPDAQPEIQDLARTMKAVMAASEPRLLQPGEWHLPYVTDEERLAFDVKLLRKVSAARCARVSYLTHDGQAPSIEKDLELYDKLVGSRPLHASPVEHQATPDRMSSFFYGDASGDVDVMEDWEQPLYHGNFVGWIQYRKHIEAEFAAA